MGLFTIFRKKELTRPIDFPEVLDNGQKLYKVYDDIDICIITDKRPNYRKLRIGDRLFFKQEPQNRHDRKAVAIYKEVEGKADSLKVGYLYRGIGQDMTNDFLKRGDTVTAYLTYLKPASDELKMTVAYYMDFSRFHDVKENTPAKPDTKNTTTDEELEAYFIVKNLLKDTVDREDVLYKDNVGYMAILYKGKSSNWICRLYFNSAKKYITVHDDSKNGMKIPIDNVYDIEKHKGYLISAVTRFISQ